MAESEHLLVVSGRDDDTVVLFERDPAHPDGEAFVGARFNGKGQLVPVAVGRTATVVAGLHNGSLIEVGADGNPVGEDIEPPEPPLAVTLGSGERPVGESASGRQDRLSIANTATPGPEARIRPTVPARETTAPRG